jgi:replicative DNA helicase
MFHNAEAERTFLSGLCQNPGLYYDLFGKINEEDFTQRPHKIIWSVINSILVDPSLKVDKVTESTVLARMAQLNLKGMGDAISDILIFTGISDSDTLYAFKQVKDKTIKRVYHGNLNKALKYLDSTTDNPSDVIRNVENVIIDSSKEISGVENEIVKLSERAIDIIMDLAQKPGELGLDIGFPVWQRSIGGLRNGSVTFMAATSKAGKSMLGLRAAITTAEQGLPSLVCDTELNEVAQSVRAFGQYASIPYDVLETGYWKLSQEKLSSMGYSHTFIKQCQLAQQTINSGEVVKKFKSLPLHYYCVNGLTVQEALPFLRRWVIQHLGINKTEKSPRGLIVWDYIKLARVDEVREKGVGAHDILGAACGGLHDFAEYYNLPILTFGQTNREMDDNISCIAGAKKITELTDSSSLLKAKSDEEKVVDPNGSHMIRGFVTRFGMGLGKQHVNLAVDLSMGKFKELGLNTLVMPEKENKGGKKRSRSDSNDG